ncbi:membrane protein insertion efficiency factor YidD [Mycobacterium simiae]|uniref:Putative membrane protein insertion efficiency factor n=1 Tax=Mycobacterium simiae TaxID=1784 RepID=A0A5B1BIU3_MYCSI|nr:membrane protein insertion efficiency factor YidD [Mycobacterium simiae]KAA1247785.1 membrane protein insertion efficiency factor YidD [Mycobacterium simiae]
MRSAWTPGNVVRSISQLTVRALIYVIELYRHLVSPLRPACCRFIPTCSQYAVAALTEYGLTRGSWLTVIRLAKCGPWHHGGWDPIPERLSCRAEDVSWAVPANQGESGSFV